MSLSLTWLELPPSLLEPLMAGAISLVEAAELFDLSLATDDELIEVPRHLNSAVERLALYRLPMAPPLH